MAADRSPPSSTSVPSRCAHGLDSESTCQWWPFQRSVSARLASVPTAMQKAGRVQDTLTSPLGGPPGLVRRQDLPFHTTASSEPCGPEALVKKEPTATQDEAREHDTLSGPLKVPGGAGPTPKPPGILRTRHEVPVHLTATL